MNKFEILKNNFNLEFLLSFSTLMELGIIITSGIIDYFLHQWSISSIANSSKGNWKFAGDAFSKIVNPIIFSIIILISSYILNVYQDTNLLDIAQILAMALILIRLVVYLVRYILQPNPLLNAYENILSFILWIFVALYLFGILKPILNTLESITFSFGEKDFSILLVIQLLIGIFVSIIVAMTLGRFIENRLMKINQLSLNGRVMINKVLRIALYVIAVVIALDTIGLDLTFLTLFVVHFVVGIDFGMQKIESNFITVFTIFLDKSVQIGDILTIGEHYGIVNSIQSRYTVLRKLDGVEVIIPNETLIAENIVNHTSSDRKVRVAIDIQIGYNSSVDEATKIMLSCSNAQERVIKENPEPTVYLMNFGESGIDLKLVFFILDAEEGTYRLRSDINKEIWKQFTEKNIEIPFPQRVIQINKNDNIN